MIHDPGLLDGQSAKTNTKSQSVMMSFVPTSLSDGDLGGDLAYTLDRHWGHKTCSGFVLDFTKTGFTHEEIMTALKP